MMCWHLDLRGNAYARIDMRKNGNPGRLIPLNPDKITPKLDGQQELYYEYRTDMGGVQITRRTDPPPQAIERGRNQRAKRSDGAIKFSRRSARRGYFSHSLFKNMAQPSGVLKHPGKFRDKKRRTESLIRGARRTRGRKTPARLRSSRTGSIG